MRRWASIRNLLGIILLFAFYFGHERIGSLKSVGDSEISEKNIEPKSVKTWRIASGELKAFIAGETFYLQVNGRTVYQNGDTTGGGPQVKWLFRSPQWGDIFLLDIYEGDGCAYGFYQVMRISAAGAENMSKEFGNCNEAEIRQKGEDWIFHFSAREYLENIYPSETWIYRNGSLRRFTSGHPSRK